MTISAPMLAVFLLAILAGVSIPVLYQLYMFVRRARVLLETTGPRLEQALVQVGQATERLNGIASSIEAQIHLLRPALEAVSRSGRWLGSAMSFGGAIAPAVVAGARALFSGNAGQPAPHAGTRAGAEPPQPQSLVNVSAPPKEGHQ